MSARLYLEDLAFLSDYVYIADAAALLKMRPETLEAVARGQVRLGDKNPQRIGIKRIADFFRSQLYHDLYDLSLYLDIKDAAKLLGTTPDYISRSLERAIANKPILTDAQAAKLHELSKKIRRREGQIERVKSEDQQRKIRRATREQLRAIGKVDVPLPDYLPPFLRMHNHGKLGSAVYIYDFRKMRVHWKIIDGEKVLVNDIEEFFRFMKTVLPGGSFFLSYEVLPGGTSPQGSKNYYLHRDVVLSTQYIEFCKHAKDIEGTCFMLRDSDFYDFYKEVGDVSAGRRVIECGISHPRPPHTVEYFELTPDEILEDQLQERDWVSGKKIIWQD
jgi:hypothetical protein